MFHNNHWSTNSSSIAGDMNGPVMMVDVNAYKLAKLAGSTEFPKIVDEARRGPC